MSGEPGAATANTVPTHTHTPGTKVDQPPAVCVCVWRGGVPCLCVSVSGKRGGDMDTSTTETGTTGTTSVVGGTSGQTHQPQPLVPPMQAWRANQHHHTPHPQTHHKAQGTKDLVVCGWHGAQLGAFHPQQQQEEEEEEEERTEREGEGTGRKGEAASTAPVSGGGVMATRGLAPSHKPPTTKPIHHHSLTHSHTGRKRKRTRKKTGQDKGQGVVGWCGGWQDHHKASWLVTTSVLGPHPTLCPLPCLALPCLALAWLGHTPFFLWPIPPFSPLFSLSTYIMDIAP